MKLWYFDLIYALLLFDESKGGENYGITLLWFEKNNKIGGEKLMN